MNSSIVFKVSSEKNMPDLKEFQFPASCPFSVGCQMHCPSLSTLSHIGVFLRKMCFRRTRPPFRSIVSTEMLTMVIFTLVSHTTQALEKECYQTVTCFRHRSHDHGCTLGGGGRGSCLAWIISGCHSSHPDF